MDSAKQSAPLWCKSVPPSGIMYSRKSSVIEGVIEIRSFQLENDVSTIHKWVNQPYSRRFWQLNYTIEAFSKVYGSILSDPDKHSFVGLFNKQVVCQIDLYQIVHSDLAGHVSATPNDCGLHFLMAPPRQTQKGLSRIMLASFLDFYFSSKSSGNMFVEPDELNDKANLLAQKIGFKFLKKIDLSYKTANLYSLNKDDFYSTCHHKIFNHK